MPANSSVVRGVGGVVVEGEVNRRGRRERAEWTSVRLAGSRMESRRDRCSLIYYMHKGGRLLQH